MVREQRGPRPASSSAPSGDRSVRRARRARVGGLAPGLAVALVVAAAVAGLGVATVDRATVAPDRVALTVSADAGTDGLTLLHRGGPTLDVRSLDVRILLDGRPLAHQPPVPFFAATGFRGGPTGPFNVAADPRWSVGERAGLRVASTNEPALRRGVTVTVRLRRGGAVIASARTTVS